MALLNGFYYDSFFFGPQYDSTYLRGRHDLQDLLDSSLVRQFPDETGETQSAPVRYSIPTGHACGGRFVSRPVI